MSECGYCHQSNHGELRSLMDFRISEGRQECYSLKVSSFDGGDVSIEDVPRLSPYGGFRKFNYCPMCGRRLADE